jgi:hypothetical protein
MERMGIASRFEAAGDIWIFLDLSTGFEGHVPRHASGRQLPFIGKVGLIAAIGYLIDDHVVGRMLVPAVLARLFKYTPVASKLARPRRQGARFLSAIMIFSSSARVAGQ